MQDRRGLGPLNEHEAWNDSQRRPENETLARCIDRLHHVPVLRTRRPTRSLPRQGLFGVRFREPSMDQRTRGRTHGASWHKAPACVRIVEQSGARPLAGLAEGSLAQPPVRALTRWKSGGARPHSRHRLSELTKSAQDWTTCHSRDTAADTLRLPISHWQDIRSWHRPC